MTYTMALLLILLVAVLINQAFVFALLKDVQDLLKDVQEMQKKVKQLENEKQ